MIEIFGDFWRQTNFDYYCITTNGVVKKNGRCVMGRGIAQQARDRFTDFDLALGQNIISGGNKVSIIGYFGGDWYVSFPVKHAWWERADIDLIKKSAEQLVSLADDMHVTHVLLPRPGCGNGGLPWDESDHDRILREWTATRGHKGVVNPKPDTLPIVKDAIKDILDDRFAIIERKDA